MRLINIDFAVPTLNANPESLSICRNSILSQSGLFNKRIFVEKGYGFAATVNRAIKKGKSSYLAIINDDVKLDKNWLSEAFNVLTAYTSCAAVATRVLTYDGKSIDSCGMDIKTDGKAIKRGNGRTNDKTIYGKNEEVFGVPCSAALFKREALEAVGLFDADFVAYEEDVDLSFRLRLSGYRICYAPKAVAFHKIGATSSKMGNFKARMDAKNWIFIIIKNYPAGIIAKYFTQIMFERLRNLSGLIKITITIYKWKALWILPVTLLLTYAEIVFKIPKMLRKKKVIQKRTKNGYEKNTFLFSSDY